MYDNPSQVRNLRINLSVSEGEYLAVKGMAMLNSMQMTALWRDLAIQKVREIHEAHLAACGDKKRATDA